MLRLLSFLSAIFLITSCSHTKKIANSPDNIILFIGDGMGQTAITATRTWKQGLTGQLFLDSMPVVGLVKTYSASHHVTDSAAAATSMATGLKADNGAIGLAHSDRQKNILATPPTTILDLARKSGKSIGIVTTTYVMHATPAAFYAHQEDRHDLRDISLQINSSKLDLLLGGGLDYLLPNKKSEVEKEQIDVLSQLSQDDWKVFKTKAEMIPKPLGSKLIGLFSPKHLPYIANQTAKERSEIPTLKEMVQYAVKHLSQNPKGFILIAESGRIDQAAHANQARKLFGELTGLDEAIAEAHRLTNSDNTLILVTADHETGGLAINGYLQRAEQGDAILGNTKYRDQLRSVLSWATGPGMKSAHAVDLKVKDYRHKAAHFEPLAAHTGVDVPIYASGPGSILFSGTINNTDIFYKMKALLKK